MKFLHSLFREFQNQELGQSKMCETKIKSWSKQTEFFFSVEKDTKLVEMWWKKFRDLKQHQIFQNHLFQTAKIRFSSSMTISKFFLIFFSGKRAGFIQTLLKTTVKIPPNIQCRHSQGFMLSHVNSPWPSLILRRTLAADLRSVVQIRWV